MKTIIVTLALLFAASLSAKANSSINAEEQKPAVTTAQAEEFAVVKFEELKAEVQTAIKGEIEKAGCKIKEVSQCKQSKNLKVVAVNAQNAEVTFLFDEAGKPKKENKE